MTTFRREMKEKPVKWRYQENINFIYSKLDDAPNDIVEEYRLRLEEMHEDMLTHIDVAENLKRFKLESIEHAYEAEVQAAWQDFQDHRASVYEEIKEELEEKINSLQREHEMKAAPRPMFPVSLKNRGRRKKPIRVRGPYIVYRLRDDEILEDVIKIREALAKVK